MELRFEEETGDRSKCKELSRAAVGWTLSQMKQVAGWAWDPCRGSAVGTISGKSSSGCRLGSELTGEEVGPAEEHAVPGGERCIARKGCDGLRSGVRRDGPWLGRAVGTAGWGPPGKELLCGPASSWCSGKGGPLHRAGLFTLPPVGLREQEAPRGWAELVSRPG